MDNALALPANLQTLINEYDEKLASHQSVVSDFNNALTAVKQSCAMRDGYSGDPFRGHVSVYESDMPRLLLQSAWKSAWSMLKMDIIAPRGDKERFEQSLAKPPEFNIENLKASFGEYLEDPMTHILRGMAEIFVRLDPAYRSHSKVKVGVKGLPKRIIMTGMHGAQYSGRAYERLNDLLSALQVFDGDGPTPRDIVIDIARQKRDAYRGLKFKWFQNGNLHVHFDEHACLQINRALAAYYGDVLPDVEEHTDTKRPSTALSKDLQYYPTPDAVADKVVDRLWYQTERVLEPSCGCGRLIDAIKRYNPKMTVQGIEVNPGRVSQSRAKGHNVIQANFLELEPNPIYDAVVMNPPFYGRHYLKHIEHAFRFIKPEGGQVVSILPSTSHYDHKALPNGYSWHDLPVGAFAESGTRVPTGFAVWRVS